MFNTVHADFIPRSQSLLVILSIETSAILKTIAISIATVMYCSKVFMIGDYYLIMRYQFCFPDIYTLSPLAVLNNS